MISKLRLQNIFDQYGGMGPMNYMDQQDFGPYDPPGMYEEPPLESGAFVPMMRDRIGTPRLNVGNLPLGQEPQNPDLPEYRSWENALPSQQQEPQPEQEDWLTRVNRLYKPETFASDRFNKFIDQYPQRQEPNWKGKLAGSLAGLGNIRMRQPGGIEAAEKAMYAPYYRDMADWKEKSQPYYQAANLERQSNIQERQLIGQGVAAETARAKLESQEKIAADKARISEIRARAYDFKQRGYTIKVLGDEVVGISPDGRRISLGNSGGLDEAEKIRLEGSWDVKAAEARGKAALEAGEQRAWEYYQQDGKTYRMNKATGEKEEVPDLPGGPLTKPGTPGRGTSENYVKERNYKLQQLADQHPEYLEFLEAPKSANDSWKIAAPPTRGWERESTFNTRMQKYNEMRKILGLSPVGGAAPKKEESKTTTPPPTAKPESTQGIGPTRIPAKSPYPRQYPPDFTGPKEQPEKLEPWITQQIREANRPPSQVAPNVYSGEKGIAEQRDRARVYLQQHNLPVTDANIEHAIRTGRVN